MLAALAGPTWYLADLGVSGRQSLTITIGVRIMAFEHRGPAISAAPFRPIRKDAVTLLASPVRSGFRASGQRIAAFAVAAVALANLHLPGRPATVCPLRALTGIPCPFCGGTTAAVHIGHLDVLGALQANPVVVVGAIVTACTPAAMAIKTRHGGWPSWMTRRAVTGAIILAVAFSEIWQLFRFGII
jgi:Protein of unknown function (DUF2752)